VQQNVEALISDMDNAAPLEAEGMNTEQVAVRRREQFEMLQVTEVT
jgi:hypothetical protein